MFGVQPLPKTFLKSIYLSCTPEQQKLVANSLHFSLSIARYQASQRPMPPKSLLSCLAQVILGRPRGRPSDSQFDVIEACAVLHLQVCYVIKPADPEDFHRAALSTESKAAFRSM